MLLVVLFGGCTREMKPAVVAQHFSAQFILL
jgi:hypothetical protein